MGWTVSFDTYDGEKVVNLDDLSPEVFEAIAKDEPGENFWGVYKSPGENPDRLYRVICAAASHAGIDPPGRPESMKAIQDQAAMFDTVLDIEEQPMQNGFPQEPGTPESGSSSGVPGDSDGTETSANDSP